MRPILCTIFGIEIRFYGICIVAGFLLALHFAKKHGKELGLDTNHIENFSFIGLICGIICARLYYVIFNWSYYASHISEIPKIWEGGLAIHGGIIGGALGGFLYCRAKKLRFPMFADIVAAPFLLGQACGRIGNFMNGEVHGVPTFTPFSVIFRLHPYYYQWYNGLLPTEIDYLRPIVPWGVTFPANSPAGAEFPGLPLHPAMLYESILNLGGFVFIYCYLRHKNKPTSYLWWTYLIIYGINRSIVSFFRAEDLMVLGLRVPHLISIIMILIGILGIQVISKNQDKH